LRAALIWPAPAVTSHVLPDPRSARPAFESFLSTFGQDLHRGRLEQQRFFAFTLLALATGAQGSLPRVPDQALVDRLHEQIANEFAASLQYVACAVHYESESLPRLGAFFYRQAVEERNHAMMMVQYLLDANAPAVIPGVAAPQTSFADIVAPVQLALDQEKRVSEQINALAGLAREQGDYASEQFLQWFIKEQVEEVSSMHALLTNVQRSAGDPLRVEEWLAREQVGEHEPDPTAPPVAGGAL
jgi:ferritin